MLKDEVLINNIKKEIDFIVSTYACTPYNPEFISTYEENDIDLMKRIDLFWDVLHTQWIINYASRKKRNANRRENTLKGEIKLLELDKNLDGDDTSLLCLIQEKRMN